MTLSELRPGHIKENSSPLLFKIYMDTHGDASGNPIGKGESIFDTYFRHEWFPKNGTGAEKLDSIKKNSPATLYKHKNMSNHQGALDNTFKVKNMSPRLGNILFK